MQKGLAPDLFGRSFNVDWESVYQQKRQHITSVASLWKEASLSSGTTLYKAHVIGTTFTGATPIDFIVWLQDEIRFLAEENYWQLESYPTVPLSNESQIIEIVIEPQQDELDLSLLGERERKFFENFVGAFGPGSDFTEDDLTPDDMI